MENCFLPLLMNEILNSSFIYSVFWGKLQEEACWMLSCISEATYLTWRYVCRFGRHSHGESSWGGVHSTVCGGRHADGSSACTWLAGERLRSVSQHRAPSVSRCSTLHSGDGDVTTVSSYTTVTQFSVFFGSSFAFIKLYVQYLASCSQNIKLLKCCAGFFSGHMHRSLVDQLLSSWYACRCTSQVLKQY